MTLQAKLTLGTVVLATVIVAINSAVYLGSIMDLQFESALRTALRVGDTALRHVVDAGNSRPDLSLSDALTNDRLTERLETEVALDNEIVEVAVVDATSGEILADNFPDRRGLQLHQPIESLEHLAHASWRQKLRVLLSHNIEHYEVERKMGPPPISVRVVVQPATIRDSMQPAIDRSAHIALLSVIGAIGLTFLFSAVAFRPLGRLRRQLDLLASGESPPETAGPKPSRDEVAIMSSKSQLAGRRRLRERTIRCIRSARQYRSPVAGSRGRRADLQS